MMNLISREALILKAEEEAEGMEEPFRSELPTIVAWLAEKIPAITTNQSDRIGKWIEVFIEHPYDPYSYGHTWYKCSVCGGLADGSNEDYCPSCGAYMKGGTNDE